MNFVSFDVLKNQTLKSIDGLEEYSQLIRFHTVDSNGVDHTYRMLHHQDCCESVSLADFELDPGVIGELIHEANEDSNRELGEELSVTWTFYRIRTMHGSLFIRWQGSSNGYYSEGVSFEEDLS